MAPDDERAATTAAARSEGSSPITLLAAAGVYFLAVFGCGFVLGVVRTLWLVPRLGERWAELVEMPWMLLAVFVAARWVVRRFALSASGPAARLAVGGSALALLVAAELAIVLELRGMTLAGYVAGRDPVSGAAYLGSLLLFAVMPLWVGRSERPGSARG